MYCPKCGSQNAESNKYCRSCREDLRVVSQAMLRRLPVVLASRFDRMLDSRSERFRRESVSCFLIALIFLIAGLLGSGGFGKLGLFFSPIFFLIGVWEYLAYRRSLSPDFDWGTSNEDTGNAEPFDKSGLVTLDTFDSHTENSEGTTDKKRP
jgi:hypothetical protein